MRIQASVYIICLNEEANIARVLNSVRDFDEVILVDSGSTDKTLEIAAGFDNVSISHQDWLGYAKQKQHAKNLCKHQWVLSLDSDQVCSAELKELIQTYLGDASGVDALDIPIVEQHGLLKKKPRWRRPNTSIRFYKKELGNYNEVSVHESVRVEGRVKRVKASILHFGHDNLADQFAKIDKYSTLRAQDKFNKGKKPSIVKLVFVFPLMLFKNMFLKRGIINGFDGFVSSMNQAFYAYLKEVKLFVLWYGDHDDEPVDKE